MSLTIFKKKHYQQSDICPDKGLKNQFMSLIWNHKNTYKHSTKLTLFSCNFRKICSCAFAAFFIVKFYPNSMHTHFPVLIISSIFKMTKNGYRNVELCQLFTSNWTEARILDSTEKNKLAIKNHLEHNNYDTKGRLAFRHYHCNPKGSSWDKNNTRIERDKKEVYDHFSVNVAKLSGLETGSAEVLSLL